MAMQNVPIFGENPFFGVTKEQLSGEKRNTRAVCCGGVFRVFGRMFSHFFQYDSCRLLFFAKHSLAEEYRSDKGGGGVGGGG